MHGLAGDLSPCNDMEFTLQDENIVSRYPYCNAIVRAIQRIQLEVEEAYQRVNAIGVGISPANYHQALKMRSLWYLWDNEIANKYLQNHPYIKFHRKATLLAKKGSRQHLFELIACSMKK